MKTKQVLALLLALILAFSLTACGGTPSSNEGGNDNGSNDSSSNGSGASTPADGQPTGLDFASEDVQPVSADRAPKSALVAAYHDWFTAELDADARHQLTYADFVEKIGCEASTYNAWSGHRVYTWEAEDDAYAKVVATLEEVDGAWKCRYFTGANVGAS